MKFISRQFYISLVFLIVAAVDGSRDLFTLSPGDGEEFVYSPVGINATIHCALNSTILGWAIHIDNQVLSFSHLAQKPDLDTRGIFQSEETTLSDSVRSSTVIVNGSRLENNNTRICCQTNVNGLKENCTTLVLYGKANNKTEITL